MWVTAQKRDDTPPLDKIGQLMRFTASFVPNYGNILSKLPGFD